ncbi:MAG: hypothetical protein N3J91_11825 [Verrucomicrobiae bacterium]|nr:hypothetical protein [Verrucomicrobiae bacterium]
MKIIQHLFWAGLIRAATLVLLSFLCAAMAQTVSGPVAGTWSWSFTMPDGAVVRPQLELKLTNGVLSGVTRLRSGAEAPITNAVLDGNRLAFEVVREREGQRVTTRYEGVIADGRIKGKLESNWTGQWQTYPWNATHLSRDIEGRWIWGPRAVELKLEGQRLKGKVILEGNAEFPVLDGTYRDGQVSFRIEREREGQPYINLFDATLQDGVLKGQITRIFGTETNRNDWEARRPR